MPRSPQKRKSRAIPLQKKSFLSFSFNRPLAFGLSLTLFVLLCIVWKIHIEKSAWSAFGENPDDNFAEKVVSAGDVNGDGYSDVAVWAPSYDNHRGKVYLYLGSPHGLSKIPAWTGQGENQLDQYGHSFGTVGDFNGDGFGDFIVASPNYSTPGKINNGRVYLYLGSPRGLGATPAWTYDGRATADLIGDCSGRAGDVNKDGLDDIIIGLYGHDYGRGAAYLFYGSKNGFSPEPAWNAQGEGANSWYGYSTASATNIKGDGYPSIIIGAKQQAKGKLPNVGKVYVYYGSKDGISKTPSWTAEGEKVNNRFGYRAISSGDARGDGHDGVIVSADGYSSPDGRHGGKVYVYYGSSEGLPHDPSWTAVGEEPGSLFGLTIASGDFNGDGYSDVIIGDPLYKNNTGKIYLFRGGPKGLSQTPSWIWTGEHKGDGFGNYVANAGDVNGDGYQDLIVGAPSNSEKWDKAGKAYLFYGNSSGKLSPSTPLFSKRMSR